MPQLGFAFDTNTQPTIKPPLVQTSVTIDGQEVGITPVFSAYWRFAAERQRIFFKRLRRTNAHSFTDDPVLKNYKFTNAYRASDRVSQYLIKNVIYDPLRPSSDEEVFFRILMFKFFNKIETWSYLEGQLGENRHSNYDFQQLDNVLTDHIENKGPIYSAAYIMPSAGSKFGHKFKHQNHLRLIEWMFENNFVERLQRCVSMSEGYDLLLSAPSIGPFLAYQYITDLNYSEITNFSEDEFVVPGPGALDGISKCFTSSKKINPRSIIKFMMESQDEYFDALDEPFDRLWGRKLQLIDCQNLFCEISKYSRVAFPHISGIAGRARIKQKYGRSKEFYEPWYPPKWGINDKISKSQLH